jgi:hypothetical protein
VDWRRNISFARQRALERDTILFEKSYSAVHLQYTDKLSPLDAAEISLTHRKGALFQRVVIKDLHLCLVPVLGDAIYGHQLVDAQFKWVQQGNVQSCVGFALPKKRVILAKYGFQK